MDGGEPYIWGANQATGFIGVYTPALRWDNLQETHGPPPPSHPTLISADLCGSVFHRSNHPGGENTGDNLPENHGPPPPIWVADQAADFIGAMLFT